MEEFDLPDDLKDDVEVIYLSEGEELEEGMEDFNDQEQEVIETEVVDLAKITFKHHKGSVFACDLSKDGTLAITGGEDDMAYLWNVSSGEIILECTGHRDSVTEVSFNHDDQYVVTADMGGLIQVWSLKERKLIWCYEGDDLEWILWHKFVNVLLSGFQSGDVYTFQVPQGNCKVLPSHGAPANCGRLLPDGKRIAVAYGDGQVKLWNIKELTVAWTYTDHTRSPVNSVEINSDATLLCATPSGDVLKLSDGKVANSVLIDGESEVETVVFNSELGIIVSGSLSGQICVWEIGRHTLRHQAKIECSVTVMKFGTSGKLFIGATDAAIYVCDARTGSLVETLTGHLGNILSLQVSKCGKFVLSTSDDQTAKIFTIKSD